MVRSLPFVLGCTAVASAHSWLGCTDQDNRQILEWMKGNATEYKGAGDLFVDTFAPGLAVFCKGWPRAKHNPGNWIDESSNYLWDIAAQSAKGDTHACHPSQRTSTYFTSENAGMATTTPGGSIKLMFGGNGHSRGANVDGGDPGTVAVYWKGGKEKEIEDIKELNEENRLKQIGFAEEAFVWPEDKNVKAPSEGMLDKGNWMTVEMPKDMEKGRHMFVWAWEYGGKPRWSTCFDVMIE
ncbi:hypothetical protein ST47_g4576 [Ascochyta rabiei]|uniref:Uncharacterized protein n=1 Tax=Didymella rabiei TaxID=5454 RepID=A0A163FDV0_DIDRA|nr:hypothetical protein ST47_g4576 [Ascochyta rabiei]